jgi:PAS domain S-box-containing protein
MCHHNIESAAKTFHVRPMQFGSGRLHAGLHSVLDIALDPVCVMNQDGIVAGWNEHAAEFFGWRRDEAVGRRLSDLIIPQRFRAEHERGLAHYLATGEGPLLDRRIEISALDREGNEFPIELSITATEQFGGQLFIGFMRDITERRETAERQQRQLQESDHRVKNMLTVVGAMAQQTARVSTNLDEFLASFSGRLDAMARSHSLLAGRQRNDVALTALAEQVLGEDVVQGRAKFGGPEILLPPGRVLGLSMILHELHTNAIKYGALCTDEGSISLNWDREGEMVRLVWSECGPPCTPPGPSSGFGNRMIAMSVKSDLKGSIERDWRPEGLTAIINFPID